MPKITYIDASGKERLVEAKNGMTVMETAIKSNISACCGACSTCHVCTDEAFSDKLVIRRRRSSPSSTSPRT